MSLRRIGLRRSEKIVQLDESVPAVEIVRVDYSERFIDDSGRRKHRVTGSPRLGASLRNRKSGRQILQLLESISHLEGIFDPLSHRLAEDFVIFFLNNKYDLVEAGPDRVENRKIDNEFAVFGDGVDLLQTAVAAAHSGSHDYKCHLSFLSYGKNSAYWMPICPMSFLLNSTAVS